MILIVPHILYAYNVVTDGEEDYYYDSDSDVWMTVIENELS